MQNWDVKTILVGYDGSDGSRQAADLAANLATKFAAQVVVLCSFKHQSRTIESGAKATKEIEEANELADSVVQRLTYDGIPTEKEVLEGPAATAILTVAEVRGVDLIVLGSRGLTAVGELLLGSTSEKVVRHAKVPVLISR
jgi:nucleotide-binding universal stress UspA family protein